MHVLAHIKLAQGEPVVEVPLHRHPVVVQPPRKKRAKFPFQGFIDFQGLKVHVENLAGSYRSGKDKGGHEWRVKMLAGHYGEIEGTEGTDGDALDVYVGPNHDSSLVVVIRQHKPDTGAYDEDKCMIGYDSVEEAVGAYKKQYDKPGFYVEDDYVAMPIGKFWRWVHDERKQGKKVAGVLAHLLPKTHGTEEQRRAAEFRSENDVVHGGRVFGQFRKEYKERLRKAVDKEADHVPAPTSAGFYKNTLRNVLVDLLALHQLYYFAHWTSRGQGFYADHELFTRLYEKTQKEYDAVAERLLGLGEDERVLDGVFEQAAQRSARWRKNGVDMVDAALGAERDVQAQLLSSHRTLEQAGDLTLGLDDLLASLASAHEENAYLLRQRQGRAKEAGVLSALAVG